MQIFFFKKKSQTEIQDYIFLMLFEKFYVNIFFRVYTEMVKCKI